MNEFPSRRPDAGMIPDHIIEEKGKPSVGAALVVQVNDAADRWAEFADPKGDISLSTFDGKFVTVHVNVLRNGHLYPREKAPAGRKGLFRRFGKSKHDSEHYFVETTDGDDTTRLQIMTLPTGATHVTGEHVTATPEGETTTKLYPGLNLEEAVELATNTIENGFPLSEEAAIKERQAQPCHEIVGNEANAVQKVVEGLIDATGVTELGDKHATKKVSHFVADNPRVDGQWAVTGVTTIFRDGSVKPNRRELSGRSILTFITFSPDTISTINGIPLERPLSVSVEGVYESGTNRLVGSQVRYYENSYETAPKAIQANPEEREAIHHAIARQVTPNHLRPDTI